MTVSTAALVFGCRMQRLVVSDAETQHAVIPTHEFAAAIGYHPESVRRCIRQGRINVLRFGRGYRIPQAELQRILREGLPT